MAYHIVWLCDPGPESESGTGILVLVWPRGPGHNGIMGGINVRRCCNMDKVAVRQITVVLVATQMLMCHWQEWPDGSSSAAAWDSETPGRPDSDGHGSSAETHIFYLCKINLKQRTWKVPPAGPQSRYHICVELIKYHDRLNHSYSLAGRIYQNKAGSILYILKRLGTTIWMDRMHVQRWIQVQVGHASATVTGSAVHMLNQHSTYCINQVPSQVKLEEIIVTVFRSRSNQEY